MEKEQFTEKQAKRLFEQWVIDQGSQRAAAKKLGHTVGYVNDMIHGRRRLSDHVLRKIGIKRTVSEVYESR